jgi:hypothetical protein
MIGGQASFQFGGFWFGLADPWPVGWLYSDPVYIDYVDGGYVLVDEVHPEVTLAVSAGDPVNNCTTDPDPAPAPAPVATVVKPVVVRPVVAYVPPVTFGTYFSFGYWRHRWGWR